MSQLKGFRRRENLSVEDRATHDARTARVIWRELVAFDREASDDPKDHGDQPYQPGNSLIDRERRGSFVVLHAPEWSGGLRFDLDDDVELNEGEGGVSLMLDRQQVYMLTTALLRWLAGTVANWARKPFAAMGMCRECGGTGFKVSEV